MNVTVSIAMIKYLNSLGSNLPLPAVPAAAPADAKAGAPAAAAASAAPEAAKK